MIYDIHSNALIPAPPPPTRTEIEEAIATRLKATGIQNPEKHRMLSEVITTIADYIEGLL